MLPVYPADMLTLDYANCLGERVGSHGLDPARLAPGGEAALAIASLTDKLTQTRGTGWERWRDLPFDPMRSEHLDVITTLVRRLKDRFDCLVVLGIGGSALGNIALHNALNGTTYNLLPSGTGTLPVSSRPGPRLFVIDNVDPAYFGDIIGFVRHADPSLERTLFNVVSKSGETAETAAQFMVVRDMLTQAIGPDHAEHVVAITDPAKGTMRRICDEAGYPTLPVPEGVGGRFSVLSPVGLFSAAMCGIDIGGLLEGAAEMDRRCSEPDITKNPAGLLAHLLVELATRKGKNTHVLMPYCNALSSLADWFRQLWAESLGKKSSTIPGVNYAGFTPVKALGTTDQHSQIQLYREGPNDKVVGFIEVEDFGDRDVTIPTGLGVESLSYLEGRSMAELLHAEKRATEYALVESQRPNFTISMPRVDAEHVGQFMYLWQMVTAYAGLMLGVNAYDQPAVETGKQATFGLMGRAGYEQFKEKVDATLGQTKWRV